MAWRGRKDVHSGTLCRDTTRGDGGRAEPPGGGEALWRSSEHDHDDAPIFGSAGLSASARARRTATSNGAKTRWRAARPSGCRGARRLLRPVITFDIIRHLLGVTNHAIHFDLEAHLFRSTFR